jgi:hypothetical protein
VPKLLIIFGEILWRVKTWVYLHLISDYVGRDCLVGIATRYGLDGPGIESRMGARFSSHLQTGRGAHPATCTMGTGSFPTVKQLKLGVDSPPS